MRPNVLLDFHDQQLKYLFFSHQLGSMRAAADELGIAPSSISRQIAKLEAELDIDLVEQGTHRIRLTEAGQVAIDYYRARASQHEALLDQLSELRGRFLGTTIIAIGEGLLGSQAIVELQNFFKQYPDAHIEIIIAPSFEVQRMIQDDEAHIGLAFAPASTATLRSLYAFEQPLRAIVSRESPLAKKHVLTLTDLANTPLVLPGPKYRVRELVTQACKDEPFTIEPVVTANSLQVILDLVRAGIASTVLPELPLVSELTSGLFKAIPLACEAMNSTEMRIIVRPSRKLSPVSLALIRHLARAISLMRRGDGRTAKSVLV